MIRLGPFATVVIVAAILGMAGCLTTEQHLPIGPIYGDTTSRDRSSQTTLGSVHVEIVLPRGVPASIRADAASLTPVVTFRLILINVGNTASPTSLLCQSTSVASDGIASATFTGVPPVTVIADVHIDNGRVASWSDFQGALDLFVGQNNIVMASPRGSFSESDLGAEVIRQLVASSSYEAQVVDGLATRVNAALVGFSPTTTNPYEDALRTFLAFASSLPRITTYPSACLMNQALGPGQATLTVASLGSPLNGLQITIPDGAFPSGTNLRVDVAAIASSSLPLGILPLSPFIRIDTGVIEPNRSLSIKIPVTIPVNANPLVHCFDPITGEIGLVPIIARTSNSVTVYKRLFGNRQSSMSVIRPGKKESQIGRPETASGLFVGEHPRSVDVPGFSIANLWKVVNSRGSIVTTEGFCMGWAATVDWCYHNKRSPRIGEEYYEITSRNGAVDQRFNTPAIWQDNCQAMRLVSQAQLKSHQPDLPPRIESDADNFEGVRQYLALGPVLMGLSTNDGALLHTVVVIGAKGYELSIADPSKGSADSSLATITFDPVSTRFVQYGAYQKFWPQTRAEHLDDRTIGLLWRLFERHTIGNALSKGIQGCANFPTVVVKSKSLGGMATPLAPVSVQATNSLAITLMFSDPNGRGYPAYLFRNRLSLTVETPASIDTTSEEPISKFLLSDGLNTLGFEVKMLAERESPQWGSSAGSTLLMNGHWADFQWFDVWYLAPPASVTAVGSQSCVDLRWRAVPGAETYNVYWSDNADVSSNSQSVTNASCAIVSTSVSFKHVVSPGIAKTYYYRIAATRGGVTSELSSMASATAWMDRFTRDTSPLASGVISDWQYGTQWLEGPDQPTNWNDAQSWITSIGNDWRMPTQSDCFHILERGSTRWGGDHPVYDASGTLMYTDASQSLLLPRGIFLGDKAYNVWAKTDMGGGLDGSGNAPAFDFHNPAGGVWTRAATLPSASYWNFRAFAVRKKP